MLIRNKTHLLFFKEEMNRRKALTSFHHTHWSPRACTNWGSTVLRRCWRKKQEQVSLLRGQLKSLWWVQFSSVQSLSRVQLFATPQTAARQASLSITQLPEFTQTENYLKRSGKLWHFFFLTLPPTQHPRGPSPPAWSHPWSPIRVCLCFWAGGLQQVN